MSADRIAFRFLNFCVQRLARYHGLLPESLHARIQALCWDRIWRAVARRENADVQLAGSERATFIETLAQLQPIHSLLDVGCGYGQNLRLIRDFFPHARLTGVDARSSMIEQAKSALVEEGIKEITVCAGTVGMLKRDFDEPFDVVCSSACLLYVPRERIVEALQDMLRLARRGVVLLEQQYSNPLSRTRDSSVFVHGQGSSGFWLHDYEGLLREVAPEYRVHCRTVARPLWTTERWKDHAAVISAVRE